MVLDSFFNSIFGWSIRISPLFAVFFISASLTLVTTLIYKYTTNQKKLKELRDEQKALQEQMKTEKDHQKLMELQKIMFQKGFLENMKHNLLPMIITALPFIIIFQWMGKTFSPFGDILWKIRWFCTYFIFN